jgi:hypothetical protein
MYDEDGFTLPMSEEEAEQIAAARETHRELRDDAYADRMAEEAHDPDRWIASAEWSFARLGRQR